MKFPALVVLTGLFLSSSPAADMLYRDVSQPVDARVADLISRLTLAEKATLT